MRKKLLSQAAGYAIDIEEEAWESFVHNRTWRPRMRRPRNRVDRVAKRLRWPGRRPPSGNI